MISFQRMVANGFWLNTIWKIILFKVLTNSLTSFIFWLNNWTNSNEGPFSLNEWMNEWMNKWMFIKSSSVSNVDSVK